MTSDLAESNQGWAQGYGRGCFASLSLSFPISKMGMIIKMGMTRLSQGEHSTGPGAQKGLRC